MSAIKDLITTMDYTTLCCKIYCLILFIRLLIFIKGLDSYRKLYNMVTSGELYKNITYDTYKQILCKEFMASLLLFIFTTRYITKTHSMIRRNYTTVNLKEERAKLLTAFVDFKNKYQEDFK